MTAVCVPRSLALLMREVMAGSVLLPTMDFMADPVSPDGFGFDKGAAHLVWSDTLDRPLLAGCGFA